MHIYYYMNTYISKSDCRHVQSLVTKLKEFCFQIMQHSLVAKNVIKENMLCEVPFYLHRECISEKQKTVKNKYL